MSSLARNAAELLGVLHGILHCLRVYNHELGPLYAEKLEPMLADLQDALFVQCDRAETDRKLRGMSTIMHTINGAATKGEHNIFPDDSDLLNHYWDLQSIFAESEFDGQSVAYNRDQDKHNGS
jgi:hypothetical protein